MGFDSHLAFLLLSFWPHAHLLPFSKLTVFVCDLTFLFRFFGYDLAILDIWIFVFLYFRIFAFVFFSEYIFFVTGFQLGSAILYHLALRVHH